LSLSLPQHHQQQHQQQQLLALPSMVASSSSSDDESDARLQQLNSVICDIVPTKFYEPVATIASSSGGAGEAGGVAMALAPFQLKVAKVLDASLAQTLDTSTGSSYAWESRSRCKKRTRDERDTCRSRSKKHKHKHKHTSSPHDDNDNGNDDGDDDDDNEDNGGVRLFSWGAPVSTLLEPPAPLVAAAPAPKATIDPSALLQRKLAKQRLALQLEQQLSAAATNIDPIAYQDTLHHCTDLQSPAGVVIDPCQSKRLAHGRDYDERPWQERRLPSQWLKQQELCQQGVDWKPYIPRKHILVGCSAVNRATATKAQGTTAKKLQRNLHFLSNDSGDSRIALATPPARSNVRASANAPLPTAAATTARSTTFTPTLPLTTVSATPRAKAKSKYKNLALAK
jgi:hypothetical protein